MNRRKAIFSLFAIGTGGLVTYSGYKWYDWNKMPDYEYLSKSGHLIAALAETIIPATDTPGAREAGVQDYIIKYVKDCSTTRCANIFINGLKEVETYAHDQCGKGFAFCPPEKQVELLGHFENYVASGRITRKVQKFLLGDSFFDLLKEYTVEGYCSSQLGATKGLAYILIPGTYKGCIPAQPGQKAWATN